MARSPASPSPPEHEPLKSCFPPVVDPGVRVLILGSLPGEASLAAGRYYAHPRNQFWGLLQDVLGTGLVGRDYAARLEALLGRGIGLWDMIARARRPGSLDQHIREAQTNDLAQLVAGLPHLRAVAFNGTKAAALGSRALGPLRPDLARLALPSSSPALTLPFAEKRGAWQALARYLPEK